MTLGPLHLDLLPVAVAALLAIPALALLARRTRQQRVRGGRLAAVTALRAAVLLALALTLAEARWVNAASLAPAGPGRDEAGRDEAGRDEAGRDEVERHGLGRDVVVIADASASVPSSATLAALREVARGLAPGDRLGLVVTAGEARLAAPLQPATEEAVPEARRWQAALADLSEDVSDLALGLRHAPALLDRASRGRAREAVLISDGRPTRGDAHAEADALAAAGWRVRVLPVSPGGPAVRAVGLAPTRPWAREGEAVQLSAQLIARIDTEVTVTLRRRGGGDGEREWTRQVRVGPEPVELTFTDAASAPGPLVYRLEVGGEAGRDAAREAAVRVRQGPRARVVVGAPGAGAAVTAALEQAGVQVEAVAPGELPEDPKALADLDLIALCDTPLAGADGGGEAGALGPGAQAALARFVASGGGLLVTGGPHAYCRGDYRGSALEEVLPVRSEPPPLERPGVALLLLLDRSASMRGPKLALAKVATREAIRSLSPRDSLGVIGFNFKAVWPIPLGPVRDAEGLADMVSVWAAGGGTDLLPALDAAEPALRESEARIKHVVVLTDGVLPHRERVVERVAALHAEGVTVSTIGVGDDAAHDLLTHMAAAGGGQHHAALSAQTLPRILVHEALDAARRAEDRPPFLPRLGAPAAPLRGVDFGEAPPLRGLARTRARPEAPPWLLGPEGRPLLAGWDRGAGRVVAWTSDDGARWATEWQEWPGFSQLLRQVVRTLAPPPPEPRGAGRARARLEAGALTLVVEAPPGLRAPRLSLVHPNGAAHTEALEEVATGRYRARLRAPEEAGAWALTVRDGRRPIHEQAVILPPASAEAASVTADVAGLRALERHPLGRRERATGAPLAPWLMAAAALLLLIEVALRRTARP